MILEHKDDHVLIKMGGRRLFNNLGRCTMKDDIEQHIRDWRDNLDEHATDLINTEEELFYRLPEILPEELEEEMACDKFVKTHKDTIETIQRKYSYKKQRR